MLTVTAVLYWCASHQHVCVFCTTTRPTLPSRKCPVIGAKVEGQLKACIDTFAREGGSLQQAHRTRLVNYCCQAFWVHAPA